MGADDDAIGARIDRCDEIGASHRDSDSFSLTDRKAFDSGMVSHHMSVAGYDVTGCICVAFLSNKLSMLSSRHKTDFLTVFLLLLVLYYVHC